MQVEGQRRGGPAGVGEDVVIISRVMGVPGQAKRMQTAKVRHARSNQPRTEYTGVAAERQSSKDWTTDHCTERLQQSYSDSKDPREQEPTMTAKVSGKLSSRSKHDVPPGLSSHSRSGHMILDKNTQTIEVEEEGESSASNSSMMPTTRPADHESYSVLAPRANYDDAQNSTRQHTEEAQQTAGDTHVIYQYNAAATEPAKAALPTNSSLRLESSATQRKPQLSSSRTLLGRKPERLRPRNRVP